MYNLLNNYKSSLVVKNLVLAACILLISSFVNPLFAGFSIKSNSKISICFNNNEPEVVHTAVDILKKDFLSVFSSKTEYSENNASIVIGTLGISNLLQELDVDLSSLGNKSQAFMLKVLDDGRLLIAGSDKLGTAYGIIQLTRMLGVSPWEWWADVTPECKSEYCLPAGYSDFQSPKVEYRGIFINDEDWGIMPWSSKNYEPLGVKGQIGPKTHERIFELLLRLRANTFWPAMHSCTVPFYFTENNKEIARKYGIFIGTSHCEPMMRNTNGEWKVDGVGEYNYISNRKNVLSFWEKRIKEVAGYDNIYTLGMRGIHDGAMNGAKSLKDQKKVLSDVISDQRDLLDKYIDSNVSEIPQVFIPYKEVLDVYNAGLNVPEYVTLMWCDDNYGYIKHFPNTEEASRPGGNGVYYHVSYWGRPHDYLWLSTASPYLIYQQMKLAYDKGIRKMWILNVGDIKPAEYQTEMFMDMAWDIDSFEKIGVTGHLYNFLTREFGTKLSSYILPLMKEHYRLAYIRKPEFMGNTRTEEKDPKYNIVTDLPWSESEINERLIAYESLERRTVALERLIADNRRTAYFHLVQYPIQGASQMNKKCLYAQLARHGKADWDLSKQAFDSIVSLTDRYNHGKWKGFMDYKPRNLSVYKEIPKMLASDSLKVSKPYLFKWNGLEADGGNPLLNEGLGYEGMAAGIDKGRYLTFDFGECPVDSVEIELRLLPSHPVAGDELRVQVSLDDTELGPVSYKTHGRSEEWKLNVLSNQAVVRMSLPLEKRKKHSISVKALDEGVVLDQLYVYGIK